MRRVVASTIVPPPNSATSMKVVPRPAVTVAESTYTPNAFGVALEGVSLSEPQSENADARKED